MDMNLFRKHLATVQSLTESPVNRDLYNQIKYLPKEGSLQKMATVANTVWATVKAMSEKDPVMFERKNKNLLSKLELMIDMLESGRVDPSEIEILQTEIMAQLLRLK